MVLHHYYLNHTRPKVIVNMWTSWCPPCKAEMPDMQKFYQEHKIDGIEVLAINLKWLVL